MSIQPGRLVKGAIRIERQHHYCKYPGGSLHWHYFTELKAVKKLVLLAVHLLQLPREDNTIQLQELWASSSGERRAQRLLSFLCFHFCLY